jgi:FAD/FMN-containing dehydrogenase/Fe-S oxidoreductase
MNDGFVLRLNELSDSLDGELRHDPVITTAYSTDASVYKERPAAVIWPAGISDILNVLSFAAREKKSITMRAGGTSLAGQVVGSGMVVDVSRHMNRILEINKEDKWVRIEPGVVLDELNMELQKHGLFFGPETSTSNRCNLGGMLGNNACGSHSLVYGSTRDHVIEIKTILSDGSEAVFGPLDKNGFDARCGLDSLEGMIYRNIKEILEDKDNQEKIRSGFPDPGIRRRNTGYAVDLLLDSDLFTPGSGRRFNLCNLLAGSEGTLAITTEIKLNLVPLPPPNKVLVCVHLRERNDAFRANLIALRHNPAAVEMMDNKILELTEGNLSQRENRFFLDGKPGAILIVEFANEIPDDMEKEASALTDELKSAGFGYSFPVIRGMDISKVWDLRKAGLGILANMKGDSKPVAVIEDTAVKPEQLPQYMEEIEKMLSDYNKEAVFHAHIGTGELHLRPILNLKDPDDRDLFRKIGMDTALLVKKYRGSLSGEHGDGRLRGEFIPVVLGEHNYNIFKKIKLTWDPENILNPGKIVDTPEMNSSLRYEPGRITKDIKTVYDFSSCDGIIRAAEKCNGSADCRKSSRIGGVMCPSYMATGEEDKTTRARANVLREFMSMDGNPWDHPEIHEVLDLCLGCKGCKAECPSGVDMAKLKSEFMQHWYDLHGTPLRTVAIAYITSLNRIGAFFPPLYNSILKNRIISSCIKKIIGFAPERTLPLLGKTTFRRWLRRNLEKLNPSDPKGTVCLFIDEFTNYNDSKIGIDAVKLLTALNYRVMTAEHGISARTFISKGLLRQARKIIRKNITVLSESGGDDIPFIGIEPSAILGFRDEYPELAGDDLREMAEKLATRCFLFEEFITAEFKSGNISSRSFTDKESDILLHAHCQQKAVASSTPTIEMLSIPVNFRVREIPSGCCGMAGSFGYEKEHYDLSIRIGELILFPEIRSSISDTIIAAPGTSCRHHILDGTGRTALHPVSILYNALRSQGLRY